jgi:hypothetical protein
VNVCHVYRVQGRVNMSEEEGEEVGTKKRRSARILELEEEKEKKKSSNKDQEEAKVKAKAKSISKEEEQYEGGPEEDHEEMEEQCPSTTEAAGEAPTVEEGTLEDVAVTFVASPCQQVSLLLPLTLFSLLFFVFLFLIK